MNDFFGKVQNQIGEFLKSLSTGRKLAMVGIGAAIFAGIAFLFMWAGETTYVPLMTNLNPEDATNIIRVLRDKRISFRVDPTGRNISIPSGSLYELRLELATMGLPQSSVVGYEVFDKQSLGTTSYVQKVNHKRAIEGELMRTINTINGVKRSRVHLALPPKSTFIEDQKRASASVVLDLEAGTVLTEKEVYGISNLIARAVEGMEVGDVVIMNSSGKLLSKNTSEPLAAATATQLDYQEKLQNDLEKKIEQMLSVIVGEGRAVARVSANLDFSQVNETQTVYDADGAAVRSVEKHNDSMNGTRPGPYGVSGNASNAPGQPPAANGAVKTETVRNNEVTNYDVPQTVRKTLRSVGTIKRLSVAVVLDGKLVKTKDKDGKVTSNTESWSAEKLKEFEEIIASAVGLDRKRGDTLEIKNIEFSREDFEEAQRVIAEKEQKSYIRNIIIYSIIGIAILLFFLFIVRPFIRWVTDNTVDSVDTFLPQTIEELEKIQRGAVLANIEDVVPVLPESIDPAKVEGEMIKEKIITLVDANPHKAALILKDWLHIDPKKRAAGADGKVDEKAASA